MRRIVKVLAIVLTVQLAFYAAALVAKVILRRRAPGIADPLADEFDLVNVMEGTEFRCRATALRAASVKNVMGGVELNLTEARLSPGGAYLEVTTVMGGTEIIVPRGWRVAVLGQAIGGAHDTDVTPEDDLGATSPTLTIEAKTVMGALEVHAERAPVPA